MSRPGMRKKRNSSRYQKIVIVISSSVNLTLDSGEKWENKQKEVSRKKAEYIEKYIVLSNADLCLLCFWVKYNIVRSPEVK